MSPLVQLILLPVAFAWLSPLVARMAGVRQGVESTRTGLEARQELLGRLVAAFPLGLALHVLLTLAPAALEGPTPTAELAWIPEAGLSLSLRLDPLALVACGLTLGVALIATLCARPRPDARPDDAAHLGLTSATLAAALCDSLPGVLSAVGVMVLIAVGLTARAARQLELGPAPGDPARATELRRAARLLWALQTGGLTALLVAGLLLEARTGSLSLAAWPESAAALETDPATPVIIGLVAFGAAALAGLAPLHLAVPPLRHLTSASGSLLTTATIAPAGLCLLVRLAPTLSGHPAWLWAVGAPGLLSLFVGAYQATRQHDMHGILCYGATSQGGLFATLLALCGPTNPAPTLVAVGHLAFFGLARGVMFGVASDVAHAGGTRDLRELGGLRQARPMLWTASLAGTLLLSGLPPFSTFHYNHRALAATEVIPALAEYPSLVPGILGVALGWTFAWSFRLGFHPFFGKPETPRPPEWRPSARTRLGGVALALPLAGLLTVGAVPALQAPLLTALARTLAPASPAAIDPLLAWPGPGPSLAVLIGALVGGTIWFAASRRLIADHERLFPTFSALDGWERLVRALSGSAGRLACRLEAGGATAGASWVLAGAVGLVAWAFLVPGPEQSQGAWWLPSRASAAWSLGVAAGLALVTLGLTGILSDPARRKTGVLVVALGVAVVATAVGGSDLAVAWVAFGAAAASLDWRGNDAVRSSESRLPRLAVALAAGAGATLLVWTALRHAGSPPAGRALLAFGAPPEGGGPNLVATLRLDLFGLPVALGIAALAAAGLALARTRASLREVPPPDVAPPRISRLPSLFDDDVPSASEPAEAPPPTPPEPLPLVPVAIGLLAACLALTGPEQPGGGLGAALLAGLAAAATRGRLVPASTWLIAGGIGIAVTSGLATLFVGEAGPGILLASPASATHLPRWLGLTTARGLEVALVCVAIGVGARVGSDHDRRGGGRWNS